MINRAFVVSFILALLLSGMTMAQHPGLDKRGVLLSTERGNFTFEAASCGIHLEGDFYDIEVHGPGRGPDGEVVYFEFSSTGDYLTVGFDVTSVFESADKQIDARGFNVEVSGSTIFVDNLVVNEEGKTGHGSLIIDCRPA